MAQNSQQIRISNLAKKIYDLMEVKNPNIKQINLKMAEMQREFPNSPNVKVCGF
jgi:hypothetical protein